MWLAIGYWLLAGNLAGAVVKSLNSPSCGLSICLRILPAWKPGADRECVRVQALMCKWLVSSCFMLASVPLTKASQSHGQFLINVGGDSRGKAIVWGMVHWGRGKKDKYVLSQLIIKEETLKLTFFKHNKYIPYHSNMFQQMLSNHIF